MQITITIPDDLAAKAKARGLTPQGYVETLIAEQAEAVCFHAGRYGEPVGLAGPIS